MRTMNKHLCWVLALILATTASCKEMIQDGKTPQSMQAGAVPPVAQVTIIPANCPDTGKAIADATNAGQLNIVLMPGHHVLATTPVLPSNTTITAYGAYCDVPGRAFWFNGTGIVIHGGEWFGPGIFGDIANNASVVTLDRATVDVAIQFSNLVVNATSCTFGKPPGAVHNYTSGFKNGVVKNCDFYDLDVAVGGSITFVDNTLHNSRLMSLAVIGGLSKATFSNIRWDNRRSLINEGECVVFEDCNVTDCIFDNLRFDGCSGPLFMFYGWDGTQNFTGNKISNLVSTGPTSFGIFLLSHGVIDNNTFTGISLHRIHYPIMLGKGVKAGNKFDLVYIDDVTPVVPSDGFASMWVDQIQSFAKLDNGYRVYNHDNTNPSDRFIIADYGDERAQFGTVRINQAGGTPVCNRPLANVVVRP